MNAAGQIAVTLAALIGFGRLFLAGLSALVKRPAKPVDSKDESPEFSYS